MKRLKALWEDSAYVGGKILLGLGVIALFALAVIGIVGAQAWVLMLFMGILHLHLAAGIPAISFVQAFLLTLVINVIGSWLRSIFRPAPAVSE